MARIAIYGSCVSRDAFEVRPHPHEIVAYYARSSMVSQCADPIPYTDADMGDEISPWAREIFAADLEKSVVERIVKSRPDIVIVDLIDERLPLLRVGASLLTFSPYANQTPLARALVTGGSRVVSTDPWRDAEFRRAAPMVVGRLLEHIEPERILLHRSMYSMRVSGSGRFDRAERAKSRRMNDLLASWYDAVAAASGCRQFRPRRRTRVADPNHKWGLSPFHYVRAYYEELLQELDRVISRPC